MKKVTLITGASGALGQAFYEEIAKRYGDDVDVILLQRRLRIYPIRPQDRVVHADVVTEGKRIYLALREIDISQYREAYYIHTVGAFETEGELARTDIAKKEIEDYLIGANVQSFQNVMACIHRRSIRGGGWSIPLRVVCFGSVSDKYHVSHWRTFSETKDMLRKDLRQLASNAPNFHAVMVNLASMDTSGERRLRPSANKSYWLTCDDVAKLSLAKLDMTTDSYLEVDIFRPMPGFIPQSYYGNLDAIRNKWQKEMREAKGNETPEEVRREIPVVIEEIAHK